jgi:hypothetical protein
MSLASMWSRIEKEESGCWVWTGSLDRGGYGKFIVRNKTHIAHRFVYTALKGEIPTGLQLDHLCFNTACVNPDHLEPVTAAENMRRRVAATTHCRRGHEHSPANTYVSPQDGRTCRACNALAARRYAARKKATA